MSAARALTARERYRLHAHKHLAAAFRVVREECGPWAVLAGKSDLSVPIKADNGDIHIARLTVGGVLTVHKNGELLARSLPMTLNTPPVPDPKFKPPGWLY